jgi:hypothetical protein
MPAQVQNYLLQVNGLIDQHGWAVQHAHGDVTFPPFSYTVGLAKWGHPEIVVVGLPPAVAQSQLNTLAERVRAGNRLVAGQRIDDLLRSYACVLVTVADSRLLPIANAIYRGDGPPISAVQLVWPDPAGRFPWQRGCTTRPAAQPLLGIPVL